MNIAHITPPQRLHARRDRTALRAGQYEVNMVCHEDIGMQTAVVLLRGFVQELEIKMVIIRMEKAGGSVIPPLDEMLGSIRDIDSGETSQGILSDLAWLL